MGSWSKISILSQSNSCWKLILCSVITDFVEVFLFIWFLCSFILVLSCLPVCPTYEALQSLQLILYTMLLCDVCDNLSLCVFIMLLSLFKLKNEILTSMSLVISLNLFETLSKYGTVKYEGPLSFWFFWSLWTLLGILILWITDLILSRIVLKIKSIG